MGSGTRKYTDHFYITAKNLNDLKSVNGAITVEDTAYEPGMTKAEPKVTVKYNGMTLEEGIDYTVSYGTPNTTSMTVPVTIEAVKDQSNNYYGNYKGSVKVNGAIKAKSLADVTIPAVPAQYYTGKAYTLDGATPIKLEDDTLLKDSIKDGTTPLTFGTDFVVSRYERNTNVGTASVILAGKGKYAGEVTVSFPIVAEEITATIVTKNGGTTLKDETYSYLAASSKTGITVSDYKVIDSKTGADVTGKCDITYTDNKAAGTATIIAKGKTGYDIYAVNTFRILPKVIDSAPVTITPSSFPYTGSEIKPKYTVSATDGSYALVEGTDYTVEYKDNTDAGDAKVVVIGTGNYVIGNAKNEGYVENFTIGKATITKSFVKAASVGYAGGIEVTPAITITNPVSGKVLEAGTDYTVALKNGVNVGVAEAVITLSEAAAKNYTLSANTVRFNITKKNLADCDVTVTREKDGTLTAVVMNGTIKETAEEFVVTNNNDGTATVSVVDGGKNYEGSAKVEITTGEQKFSVGTAMISDVVVTGNTATVKLAGDVDNFVGDGEVGYDYVISKAEDYINERVAIDKNGYATETDFLYLEPGTYYAYCHAWTRDENGKKTFGDWSNLYKFEVTAETPEKPQITSVKVNGSTVTVTYTECEGAEGYDIVLGSTLGKDAAGYKRPYDYGKLVKKNIKAGTTTVTFKNVEPGTYYVGLHAWNKTSEDGKKVFSKWSNIVTRTVK